MMNLKVSRPFNLFLIFNLQLSRVMSERIVVDPLTRIEGHLRIEADIENGKIKDAYSSGTRYISSFPPRLQIHILQGVLGQDPLLNQCFVHMEQIPL